ncbi:MULTISPECIES: hypothetical protein [Streptomyces]|uniref:Fibronectin type-III domain-containing protein n=1 Tax=Streptomyces mordarskii TaxID=1226758 RepID=A0ABN1DXH9_9ACTN
MYDRSLAAEVARLKRRIAQIEKGQRVSQGASIENAALEVKDDTGSLRAIVGQQADGTSGIQVVNGPPPPAPSAPGVASVLGGVTVSWDGLFAAGAAIPLDWSRVEVHASSTPSFDPLPTTLQTTIETAQGATVVVPTDVPVYVRLLARNTSGAASPSSIEVGPYGPAPVVADDILDGIVTEVKLANDAVTAAKIAAAAVGTTEIADDAITTPKVTAGAILAAQIAAGAVVTDKLAAEAVTAAKIAALAITTDKIDANAITTSKLAAGSVDATALKADAITGKTITSGTITGSLLQTATSGERITVNEAGANKVLVYDATGRAVGELSGDGLGLEGTSGAIIWIDPDSTYPNLRFYTADGANSAYINIVEAAPGDADIGINSGTFSTPGGAMRWRTFFGRDFWTAERIRTSSDTVNIGGRIFMDGTSATVGYQDATSATQRSDILFTPGNAQLRARLLNSPPASSNTALLVETAAGHTGYMLRLFNDDAAAYRFSVDLAGNTTIGGVLSAPNIATGTVTITPAAAYTPTSIPVTGLNVAGSTFRGYATANSTVPGYRASATPPGAGVTGVSVSNVTSTGLTVWVNRENTTNTTINWMVIGS